MTNKPFPWKTFRDDLIWKWAVPMAIGALLGYLFIPKC